MEILAEDEAQFFSKEPWQRDIDSVEARREQERVVSTLLKTNRDVLVSYDECRSGIHQIHEDVPGFGPFVAVADLAPQQPVETAGHKSQLQIKIDLHGDRRGESIHMEEIDSVGEVVFYDHALSVAFDEL